MSSCLRRLIKMYPVKTVPSNTHLTHLLIMINMNSSADNLNQSNHIKSNSSHELGLRLINCFL